MRNQLKNHTRTYCMLFAVLVMLTGLFISRAALSAGMMLFVLTSLLHRQVFRQIRFFVTSPLLWSISLLFFLPLISGLWSSDQQEWLAILRIKLPLFLLPLAFAAPLSITEKQWWMVLFAYILMTFSGTCWSLLQYLPQISHVHERYLQAYTIPTPLGNDHVRFSWMVSIAVLICVAAFFQKNWQKSWQKTLVIFFMAWFIIYLHLLAARTGLLSLYGMLAVGLFLYFVKSKTQGVQKLLVISAVVLCPVIAWFVFPTLQNRVKYFLYDTRYVRRQTYLPGSNDGARFISLRAGWQLMHAAPLTGAGFGDIKQETLQWYAVHYPQMVAKDKIYPSSEWMMYGAGLGYTGFIFFTGIMLLPFIICRKNRCTCFLFFQLSAALSFIFDIGLEVQLGIFLYAFTGLWFLYGHKKKYINSDGTDAGTAFFSGHHL